MKAKIITCHWDQLGWAWLIEVGKISIEPYTYTKKELTAFNQAVRWCKRFHLDYEPKKLINERGKE
jgi:hypothetical protein